MRLPWTKLARKHKICIYIVLPTFCQSYKKPDAMSLKYLLLFCRGSIK